MFNIKRKLFHNFILIISLLSLSACNLQTDPDTILDVAVRNNDIEKAKKLLDVGVSAEPKPKTGWTPLMIAVVRNKPEMADLLLEHGADINTRNKSQTLLHLVARYGKNDMVEYLLKKGLNTNRRDWLSWTPLMWACLFGKTDIVKTLIDGGADVNAQDVDRNTPLILAAWRGHRDTAMLLIDHHANLFVINRDGFTAAQIAEKHDFNKLAKELNSLAKK
ncbi:MAG: ankyrin repeat domain-containing protein [Elusimicrobia bacterium]|nr:ankyrin repeat domain-containing protein [Elusimicrobiota bacterium]